MVKPAEVDYLADGEIFTSKAIEVCLYVVPQSIFAHETFYIFVDAIFFFFDGTVPRAAPHLVVDLG